MIDINNRPKSVVEFPEKVWPGILDKHRFKVLYGGRAGCKSHAFARAAIVKAYSERKRFLCTREFQTSIADSVHRTLSDIIYSLKLDPYFDIQQRTITSKTTGSQFIFKGLKHNIQEIKSTEGVDICWVEEAQAVSEESWQILLPTIRNQDSEVWVSFNPYEETDPTYRRFILSDPPDTFRVELSWRDNKWLSKESEADRLWTLAQDKDAYDWIWEGHCRKISQARIFRNYVVEPFELPTENFDRFYFGADWGFADDPSALIRCYIQDEVLYIDYEAYGHHVEIDELPDLFAGGISAKTGQVWPGIPKARDNPIFGDPARPETISYLKRQGFHIDGADKWQGSVEDGIEHLKGFKQIVIHPRCEYTAQEFRLYSYATDPKDQSVILPKVVDKFNHCIDSLRYALCKMIQARGAMGVWSRLAS